jgi:hypothetical protein
MKKIPPLELPEIPCWYAEPPELAEAFYQAIDSQAAAERALAAATHPDPSFEGFKRQVMLEIAVAVSKMASSHAICALGDWVDEVEP